MSDFDISLDFLINGNSSHDSFDDSEFDIDEAEAYLGFSYDFDSRPNV